MHNLATTLQNDALFYLLHLRLGCLPPHTLKECAEKGTLKVIPTTLIMPETFSCPICLNGRAWSTRSFKVILSIA